MTSNSFQILLTYNTDKEALLELPKTANLYDLKAAIQRQTNIAPSDQLLEGIQLSADLLTDDARSTYFALY